jgi:uncharacterized protein (TIGR02453 family)
MTSRPYFTPHLFRFLRELKQNNNRPWFLKNKDRYEIQVKMQMLGFISAFRKPLSGISENYVADADPAGGSLFRIYRDTRFSKDKTPYKTHAAAQFRHRAGRNVHAPGFYLHLEPDTVYSGGGLWRPDPPTLAKVRDALVAHPAEWKKIITDPGFRKTCTFEGDKLVRPPRGYDPGHPLIEWLKHKDFVFYTEFTKKEACEAGFLEKVAASCRAASGFMAFLTRAVGLEW